METVTLESLKEDLSFTGDLYIDNNFLVLPQSCPVQKSLTDALRQWEFSSFSNTGSVSLGKEVYEEEKEVEFEINEKPAVSQERLDGSVKKILEESKNDNISNNETNRLAVVENVYEEYANYIESIFTHYATHKEINQEELAETVQDLCVFIKENKRFILRAMTTKPLPEKNFLVIHSLKTSILSTVIALQLHMPLSKMIELVTASLLHEIGMLRLPPQVYMGTKKLTAGEKAMISKHTVFGYSILKDLDFPLAVQLGTLEHHEKEDGTGYPRRLAGDKISPFSKIISVACSYEAITSARNYKEERSTFDAMVEMLLNKNHAYDDSVIKALLYSVSLYPIGTYVYLKNRKVAVVMDTNPTEPKFPIVQLITERNKDSSPITIQTNSGENSILRVLTKQEQSDVLKIINEKYKLIEEAQKMAEQAQNEIRTKPQAQATTSAGTGTVSNSQASTSQPVSSKPVSAPSSASPVSQSAPNTGTSTQPQAAPANTTSQATSQATSSTAAETKSSANNPDGTEEVDISFFD